MVKKLFHYIKLVRVENRGRGLSFNLLQDKALLRSFKDA